MRLTNMGPKALEAHDAGLCGPKFQQQRAGVVLAIMCVKDVSPKCPRSKPADADDAEPHAAPNVSNRRWSCVSNGSERLNMSASSLHEYRRAQISGNPNHRKPLYKFSVCFIFNFLVCSIAFKDIYLYLYTYIYIYIYI